MAITLITHHDCLLHDPGLEHPESPDRINVINTQLKDSGLDTVLHHVEAPLASQEQLQYIHDKNYVDSIFKIIPTADRMHLDADTVMNEFTLTAALRAAGAVIKAVDLVMEGDTDSVFCNVRPPGHHAERAKAMGFCFFNNLAIGVAYALKKYHLKRIAVVDFDVHRGNGTEEAFQNNDKVLICSSYELYLYPNHLPRIDAKNIIDIPLASNISGAEFRAQIQRGLDRVEAFEPQLIFFSAGFDAHRKDAISTLNLVEEDYLWVTQQVKKIADQYCEGRIISVLEGGYALDALGESVVAHIQGLMG